MSILQNFDLATAEFNANRSKVTTFLQTRDVPYEVQLRVANYLDSVYELNHGVEEHALLDKLPSFLRHDIVWFLNQQFLEKLPMFYGADVSALLEINRYLATTVATKGEYVARDGDLAREMHFVISGEIHVLTPDRQTDIELFDGYLHPQKNSCSAPSFMHTQTRTTLIAVDCISGFTLRTCDFCI